MKYERIFDLFQGYYNAQGNNFQGLPQVWCPLTGLPAPISDKWEGDNAFLLFALNYYNNITGSFGNYQELANGLKISTGTTFHRKNLINGLKISTGTTFHRKNLMMGFINGISAGFPLRLTICSSRSLLLIRAVIVVLINQIITSFVSRRHQKDFVISKGKLAGVLF